MQDKEDPY